MYEKRTTWFDNNENPELKPGLIVLYNDLPYVIINRLQEKIKLEDDNNYDTDSDNDSDNEKDNNDNNKNNQECKNKINQDKSRYFYYQLRKLIDKPETITIYGKHLEPFSNPTSIKYWNGIDLRFEKNMIVDHKGIDNVWYSAEILEFSQDEYKNITIKVKYAMQNQDEDQISTIMLNNLHEIYDRFAIYGSYSNDDSRDIDHNNIDIGCVVEWKDDYETWHLGRISKLFEIEDEIYFVKIYNLNTHRYIWLTYYPCSCFNKLCCCNSNIRTDTWAQTNLQTNQVVDLINKKVDIINDKANDIYVAMIIVSILLFIGLLILGFSKTDNHAFESLKQQFIEFQHNTTMNINKTSNTIHPSSIYPVLNRPVSVGEFLFCLLVIGCMVIVKY